jgi:hypothetical protein
LEKETKERSGRFAFLRKPSTRYSVGALLVVGMLFRVLHLLPHHA